MLHLRDGSIEAQEDVPKIIRLASCYPAFKSWPDLDFGL